MGEGFIGRVIGLVSLAYIPVADRARTRVSARDARELRQRRVGGRKSCWRERELYTVLVCLKTQSSPGVRSMSCD